MPGPLRSKCPIAGALDILGDTWTLLVLRDLLFYDKHRFADFLASPEGISTNILTERLTRLERSGLVERRRYQERPPRDEYHLTSCGYELLPVLRELIHWGKKHVPGVAQQPPPGAIRHPQPPAPVGATDSADVSAGTRGRRGTPPPSAGPRRPRARSRL